MTFMKIFGRDKAKHDCPLEPANNQIRLKKPDPDYRRKQEERVHDVLFKTTEFGMDEVQIVIDQLKKRENHIYYRSRIAYLAGEIGKDIMYGYPNQMIDDLMTYLLCELDGRSETMMVASNGLPKQATVSQPNVASMASLVALEKISSNDDLYVSTLVHTNLIPNLKKLHKTTAPELRPRIRQTIINIKTVCPSNPMDAIHRSLSSIGSDKRIEKS